MNSLEACLTDYFSGTVTTLFARGSAGLYVLFRCLKESGPGSEVIIPAICCEAVAMAAIYAGLKPVIADVDRATLCLSYESVCEKLSDETAAILLVYIFGISPDIDAFAALKTSRDIIIIEDIAQAAGGAYQGNRHGSLFDFTLLSFEDRKIINGTGGALVQRTAQFEDRIRLICEQLPRASQPHILKLKTLSWRNFVHSLFDLSRSDERVNVSEPFAAMLPFYEEIIVHSGGAINSDDIIAQVERLPVQRRQRYEKYEMYRHQIKNESLHVIDFAAGAMCWRVPVVLDNPMDTFYLTALLRQHGILVSNHYFPLDRLLYNTSHVGSAFLLNRLLNLWVDDLMPVEQINRAVSLINGYRGVSS